MLVSGSAGLANADPVLRRAALKQGRTSRVMLINGTADPINPYQAGMVTLFGFASRGSVMSSVASAQNFAERNGIRRPAISGQLPKGFSGDPTSVETLTWHANGELAKPAKRD